MAGRILDGITVLDVGGFIAGPAAAAVMAGFGAEVIKVEPPGGGDPYRNLVEIPGMPLSEHHYVEGQDKVSPARAPHLGEHTEELLRRAGLDAAALGRLRASGAIR